jgi:hypothetical protein
MSTTALIESSASHHARDTQPDALHDADDLLAGLPPLLTRVPVAGPPVWVIVGFGGVLLLLLVPPLALLVTLMGVALLAVTAVVALVVLTAAIVTAPFRLVRRLREHRLPHFSVSVPSLRHVKARRV